MNDQRFFDLAMKVIARQASDAERNELEKLLARQPELKTEFERLRAEVRVAKEVLPLVAAAEATSGEFPAFARERLQTKVRQTLGGQPAAGSKQREDERAMAWGRPNVTYAHNPAAPESKEEKPSAWSWRWWLGLVSATALTVVLLVTLNRPSEVVIEVAMLDIAGAARNPSTNETAILQQVWKQAIIAVFSRTSDAEAWEQSLPDTRKRPIAKIIYDRAAGEVRAVGRWKDRRFEKTFPVENDLATALKLAHLFVEEQTKSSKK